MIELALHYARNGWPVFPLAPMLKVPAIARRDGGHGCHDATTNETIIEAWWTQFPDANVGIATGTPSGLLVVDVDVKRGKAGLASMQELRLPPTFTVRTPTQGFHCYFRMPSQALTLGADLLPGIDWRGTGGYVVAAGSRTRDGMYQIARNLPIAETPSTLVNRILAKREKPVTEPTGDGRLVIAEGARDQALTRIAGALRRFGIEEPAIAGALGAVNAAHCAPPLDADQLQKIAHSVMRYAPAEARRS